ncbi:MAG: right-handed parallel beta-helix repeat-containing protein [Terriglobia bacterium]
MSAKSKYLLFIFLAAIICLHQTVIPPLRAEEGKAMTVTVGAADADVIGTDNVAIQKAIDRVAAAGGGTVLIKAGTYTLENSVRLCSHLALKGEGAGKTILKKAMGVRSPLKLDADYGEFIATVEDASRFAPGMGVTILDKVSPSGWTPSVRTIVKIDGNTLHFDRFLHMDYSVEQDGRVFNTFPLIAGYEVEDVRVEDLTADGTRTGSDILDGCQAGAIYFFHSQRMRIHNCVARNFPGDGISTQFVEDPVIENCEAYGNAYLGIHLGTGALRGIVRQNRSHDNGQDGIYLCWRVQHGHFADNQSWSNGQDGISIGHKDTDNVFLKNMVSGNARAGVFFRDEPEANAGHRNVFRENTIENNGRPGAPGCGVRIEGATQHITLQSNTIRDSRPADRATQEVGIYIGPRADYVISEKNIFSTNLKRAIADESTGGHNQIEPPSGAR